MYLWQYLIEIDWITEKYESEFQQKIFTYVPLKIKRICCCCEIYHGKNTRCEHSIDLAGFVATFNNISVICFNSQGFKHKFHVFCSCTLNVISLSQS